MKDVEQIVAEIDGIVSTGPPMTRGDYIKIGGIVDLNWPTLKAALSSAAGAGKPARADASGPRWIDAGDGFIRCPRCSEALIKELTRKVYLVLHEKECWRSAAPAPEDAAKAVHGFPGDGDDACVYPAPPAAARGYERTDFVPSRVLSAGASDYEWLGVAVEEVKHLDGELERCERALSASEARAEAMREAKDGAYRERDRLVAALSKLFPAWLERHPESDKAWEDDWRWIVFIEIPSWHPPSSCADDRMQVSWHIHDSELSWFDHLERRVGPSWDGHSTEEKYRRLAAIRAAASARGKEAGRG